MKRIIEIDESVYKAILVDNFPVCCSENIILVDAIKNSKPIDTSGDLISREALKKDIEENAIVLGGVLAIEVEGAKALIDIAPTVAINCKDCDGYEAGYSAGLNDAERPQGDLISRETLKEAFDIEGWYWGKRVIETIDNAPIVELKDVYQEGHYDGHVEGYTKAINEERPQGDLISRESARMCLTGVIKDDMTISDFICRTDKRLREIPACEERPKGEWNYIQAGMLICPFCGATSHKDYKDFCAKCGADLRKAVQND